MTETNPAFWLDVAALDDVWDGAGIAVTAADRSIAVFRLGNQVFATDLLCTHGNARLCDGFVEGHEVECPLHQGRFDLRTGAATCEPAVTAVATYPARIVDLRVQVQVKP